MRAFLEWFNSPPETDGVIRAATAHLWFAAVHPFQDGNGRIAQGHHRHGPGPVPKQPHAPLQHVAPDPPGEEHVLPRHSREPRLETTGTCDITAWLSRFARCLGQAMDDAMEAP